LRNGISEPGAITVKVPARCRPPLPFDPHELSRTAIENCGIGAIPIDEINGAVGLPSKCEIPDERSVRKLTQRMGLEAITLWLRVQKLAKPAFAAAQAVPVIGALGGAAVLRIHRPLSGDCASPFHGAQARTALSKDPVRMTYDNQPVGHSRKWLKHFRRRLWR
jgi:hypothetical protein